jgi:hypothetical protein
MLAENLTGGIAILINDCECGFKYGGADDAALGELVGANQPERSMVLAAILPTRFCVTSPRWMSRPCKRRWSD